MENNAKMIRKYVLTFENIEKLYIWYVKAQKLDRVAFNMRDKNGHFRYNLVIKVNDVYNEVLNAYYETLQAYRSIHSGPTCYIYGL